MAEFIGGWMPIGPFEQTKDDPLGWRSPNGESHHFNFHRASGDCICSVCDKAYWPHPLGGLIGWMGQFLHRLCDGSLVKL